MICDGCEWFNLQEEVRRADAAVLVAQPRIRHFGDELAEFADAAALCALMDVVVSVDTSARNLAGALGRLHRAPAAGTAGAAISLRRSA